MTGLRAGLLAAAALVACGGRPDKLTAQVEAKVSPDGRARWTVHWFLSVYAPGEDDEETTRDISNGTVQLITATGMTAFAPPSGPEPDPSVPTPDLVLEAPYERDVTVRLYADGIFYERRLLGPSLFDLDLRPARPVPGTSSTLSWSPSGEPGVYACAWIDAAGGPIYLWTNGPWSSQFDAPYPPDDGADAIGLDASLAGNDNVLHLVRQTADGFLNDRVSVDFVIRVERTRPLQP